MVAVGERAVGFRDEAVSRDSSHRREDPGVGNVPSLDLDGDHLLAPRGECGFPGVGNLAANGGGAENSGDQHSDQRRDPEAAHCPSLRF
jgi:hypothetical protein